MSFSGCAPGKSDPMSAMVRLVSRPSLASEGWASAAGPGVWVPATGRQAVSEAATTKRDWFSHRPIIISPHQVTTLLEN